MKTSRVSSLMIMAFMIGVIECGYPTALLAAYPDNQMLPFVTVDPAMKFDSYPILSPLVDGPVSVLFIGDGRPAAQVCREVVARLDCDYACVLTHSRSQLGLTEEIDGYAPESLGLSAVMQHLSRELEQDWDVIWLDYDFESLPDGMGEVILDRVEHGTGLVMAGYRDQARDMSTGRGSNEYLSGAIGYRTIGDMEVRRRGDGVIVNLSEPPRADMALARGDFYNSAAQAILYAGRPLPMLIRGIQISDKPLEQESIRIMKYRVSIYNTGESDSVKVTVRYRDDHGQIAETYNNTFFITEENNILSLSYPQVGVGAYSLDITGENAQGVVFSGGASFTVDSVDHIDSVALWYPYAPRDDFVIGTVNTVNPFKRGMYVTVDIRDVNGRVLDTKTPEIIPSRTSVDFIMSLRDHYPRAIEAAATFYKNNVPVETVARPFFIAGGAADRLRFGVINSSGVPLGFNEYRTLADAGFDLYAVTIPRSVRPEDAYAEFLRPGIAGLQAVPDLSQYTGERERTVRAAIDTLIALDPAAFMVGNDDQARLVRTIAPELNVMQSPSAGGNAAIQDSLYNAVTHAVLIPEGWKYAADRRFAAAIPWWVLISGHRQLWWGEAAGGADGALSPWGTIAPLCDVVAREVKIIRTGIEDILSDSMLLSTGVNTFDVRLTGTDGLPLPDGIAISRVWHDGAAIYAGIALVPGTNSGSLPDTVMVHVDQDTVPFYVYDMTDGQYLGAIDSFETTLTHGGCLLALLPYRVRAIDITPDQSIVGSDTQLAFTAHIVTAGNETPGRHLLHVTLTKADRPEIIVASSVITVEKGVFRGAIHIPSDLTGQALLTVTDISSGRTAGHQIVVRNQER